MASKKPVKSILISQPRPAEENSPYFELAKKFGLKIDFRKFIQVEGVTVNEFRKQNINPLDFSAVILTSKYAIDHYFRILTDMKIEMPPDMKYFCVAEGAAKYLQKYIVIRKRKLFCGERTTEDLIALMKKHKDDRYLFPCSSVHTPQLTGWMDTNGYNYKKAIIYETVSSDLSDLKNVTYDMICFYSPSGIDSLFKNFPKFKKNSTRIAVFGSTTSKAAKEAGLKVDVEAPQPDLPSMTAAIEDYLKRNNNG